MAYLPSDLTVHYTRAIEFGMPTISFEIWSRSEKKCLDRGRGFVTNKRMGGVYGEDAAEAVEIAKRRLCGDRAA